MKKILIISYFAPPCNLTAAQRIEGWVKYLHEFGYYPIVITRNWDIKIQSQVDLHIGTSDQLKISKFDTHEIHYLPYVPNKRDKLYTANKNRVLRKLLSLKELVFENFSVNHIPYNNFLSHAQNLIEDNKLDKLIISGGPFPQFQFGYILNKKTNIKWIADYRDDWTTSELETQKSKIGEFLKRLNAKSERKWVGSAKLITTISKYYANKISKFTTIPSEVIENGFFDLQERVSKDTETFRITYNGTLYPSQEIEPFLEVISELILYKNKKIELHFPGLAFDKSQKDRVEKLTAKISGNVNITERIEKSEVIKIQSESDLLLMLSHKNLKGIPSSKLYEYISFRIPILHIYPDNDIAQDILTKTELGLFPKDKSEIKEIILKVMTNKNHTHGNLERIMNYSRKNQTKKLAELLDNLN